MHRTASGLTVSLLRHAALAVLFTFGVVAYGSTAFTPLRGLPVHATGTLIEPNACVVSYQVAGHDYLILGRSAGRSKDPICTQRTGATASVFYDPDDPVRSRLAAGGLHRTASGIMAVLAALGLLGTLLSAAARIQRHRREQTEIMRRARQSGRVEDERTTVYYTAGSRDLALSPARIVLTPGAITVIDHTNAAQTFSAERAAAFFYLRPDRLHDQDSHDVYLMQGSRRAAIHLDALAEMDTALVMRHLETIATERSHA